MIDEKQLRAEIRESLKFQNQPGGMDVVSMVGEIRGGMGGSDLSESPGPAELPGSEKLTAGYRACKKLNQKLQKLPGYHTFLFPVVRGIKRLVGNHKYRQTLTCTELLSGGTEEFLDRAYLVLLERQADEQGKQAYRQFLYESRGDRIFVLGRIRYSPEGRMHQVTVKKLRSRYFCRRMVWGIRRIPILGLVYWLKDIATVSKKFDQLYGSCMQSENRISQNACNAAESRGIIWSVNGRLEELSCTVGRLERDTGAVVWERLDKNQEAIYRMQESMVTGQAGMESLRQNVAAIETGLEQCSVQAQKDTAEAREQLERFTEKYRDEMDEVCRTAEHNESDIYKMQEALYEIEKIQAEKAKAEQAHSAKQKEYEAIYVEFENKFRGERSVIKQRLTEYLKMVENLDQKNNHDYTNVLDIGCGRGEWLELLKENRFIGAGVDLNAQMVQECKKRNLSACYADAISYLKGLEDASYYVITGFQIVEHLSPETVLELLQESLRVLKPGGFAIFETPNPENLIVGACNFYLDPSHIRPIPPERLRFVAESIGYDRVDLFRLNPYPAIPEESVGQGDEAVRKMAQFFNNMSDYSILAYKK